jgi:hypothetical protein
MIAELKNYEGVLCKWCNEPIPVSPKVTSVREDIERGETNTPCSFTARCRLCEYENVYEMADLRMIEGEPRKRPSKARAAGR